MIDLDRLNPPQREAVLKTEGPLLVLAGAGSGKTRVLTHRIAYLIEKGTPAWSILAITFTNKAAREMQRRVANLSGTGADEAWISTFHSCCARILRRDIEKLGYKRSFSIYDDDDTTAALRAILKEMNLDDKQFPPREMKSHISGAKNKMLTPEEWLNDAGDDYRNRKICEVYKAYEKTLKSNNALDFDDLLIKTLELFTMHPPVLDGYRRKFSYIMVDEYQDTNMAQYSFIQLLAAEKRNICVVGDDDQSIYGWRGADIRNILEFEKDYPECTVIKLEQNYRSTETILDAANQVIAHNLGRKEKALWTEENGGGKIRYYTALDERDEAAWLCAQLSALKSEGIRPGDAAVLYRANAQSRVIEEALVRSGIPYRVYGGQKFYDRKEVKDLIAYLRAVVNPDDDISLRRVINEPRRGIGDSTIDLLQQHAQKDEVPLYAAVLDYENAGLSTRAQTAVGKFADLLTELMARRFDATAQEFVRAVVDLTGYQKQYEAVKNDENAARLQNIQELVGAIDQYIEQNPEGGIEGFLENVALVTDLDNLEEKTSALTLMTLHSAKGLEFPAVFIVGLEESIFPTTRAMYDEKQLEEERRLMYVGITRAMRRLFLSSARSRMLYGVRQSGMPSRFIAEIPPRLLDDGRVLREPKRLAPATARPVQSPFGGGAKNQPSALGIPGLQKGFGGANFVGSAAREIQGVQLFAVNDKVMHRIFGNGVVKELRGEGREARVVIEFETRGEKIFPADSAPVIKVK